MQSATKPALRSARPAPGGVRVVMALLLPALLAGTARAAPVLICQSAATPELAALPPTPLEVRGAQDGAGSPGVLIARLQGERVLVRAEDLPLLNLAADCPPGTYAEVPAELHPQLDFASLTLRVALPPPPGTLREVAAAPSTPQTGGVLTTWQGSVVAGSGNLAGQLSVSADARLPASSATVQSGMVQAGMVQSGSVQAGFRGGASVAASSSGDAASVSLQRADLYLYRQEGGSELEVGLLAPTLGGQGEPLLGVALKRAASTPPPPPVFLTSAVGGRYRLLFRGAVLAEGALLPGLTVLHDVPYPPLRGELQSEISEPGGVVRRAALPFDATPGRRIPGEVDGGVAVGLRAGAPAAEASVGAALTPELELQASGAVGRDAGLRLGLRWTPDSSSSLPALYAGAYLTGSGAGQDAGLQLGLSGNPAWGSWSVSGNASRATTAPTGLPLGQGVAASTLGLRASLFLPGSQLQLGGSLDASQQPEGANLKGSLELSGTALPGGATLGWKVQAYAAQGGSGSAAGTRAGIGLSLDLGALAGRDGLNLHAGLQDGQAQLSATRSGQLTLGETERWDVSGTVQALPQLGANLTLGGPVNAAFDLRAGPQPSAAASVSGAVAFTASGLRLIAPGTRQVTEVQLGVPGVTVRSGNASARSGSDGVAILPLSSLPRSEVSVDLDSLPLSVSLSALSLPVRPAPGALVSVIDFRPYLERSPLRQLPAFVPVGALAQLGSQRFTVQETRYIQLDARNGDRIAVSWPGSGCTATWSDAEVLECGAF